MREHRNRSRVGGVWMVGADGDRFATAEGALPEHTPDDHVEWLRRARAGDIDAFGSIVRAHQQAALRLATVISGDSAEAFDIVQEAFIKGYQRLSTIRDDAAVRGWLLRIVANEAKNVNRSRWRREQRHQRQATLRPDHVEGADERALSQIEATAMLESIAGMSWRDREIIGLRFFGGLSEIETAGALQVPPGTVKSRTSRALAHLRERLLDSTEGLG